LRGAPLRRTLRPLCPRLAALWALRADHFVRPPEERAGMRAWFLVQGPADVTGLTDASVREPCR